MNFKTVATLSATLLLASSAFAQDATQNNKRGGSLFVFPLIQKTPGNMTLLTVSNLDESGGTATAIDAHFVFRNGTNCLETLNFSKPLTPLDTITVNINANGAIPNGFHGFAYVYAEGVAGSQVPLKYDNLAAVQYVFDGVTASAYELDAYGFKAGSMAVGTTTDLDGDGIRDLNGTEYEAVPNVHIYPRVFGQTEPGEENGFGIQSELTVLSLVGSAFEFTLDILVINDKESAFSAEKIFTCHKTFPLNTISGALNNSFLANSDDADDEFVQWPRNALKVETAMLRLTGSSASSTAGSQANPALLSVLVTRRTLGWDFGGNSSTDVTASLPYGKGVNTKGRLTNLNVQPN